MESAILLLGVARFAGLLQHVARGVTEKAGTYTGGKISHLF